MHQHHNPKGPGQIPSGTNTDVSAQALCSSTLKMLNHPHAAAGCLCIGLPNLVPTQVISQPPIPRPLALTGASVLFRQWFRTRESLRFQHFNRRLDIVQWEALSQALDMDGSATLDATCSRGSGQLSHPHPNSTLSCHKSPTWQGLRIKGTVVRPFPQHL